MLVVDDDADIRETMAGVLEDEGYEVRLAEDGRAALAVLETCAPQVIVLDLMMPVMNGEEFRQNQLRDPALASIPVIVISAAYDAPVVASKLKADGFLPKPTRATDFLRAVHRIASPRSGS